MDLEKLTISDLKKIQSIFLQQDEPCFWKIGGKYLIRTVTHYYTGRLIGISKQELYLEDVAWIAETKRFYDTLTKGEFNEVEPFNDKVIVGRSAVVDAVLWKHDLPKDQL